MVAFLQVLIIYSLYSAAVVAIGYLIYQIILGMHLEHKEFVAKKKEAKK